MFKIEIKETIIIVDIKLSNDKKVIFIKSNRYKSQKSINNFIDTLNDNISSILLNDDEIVLFNYMKNNKFKDYIFYV